MKPIHFLVLPLLLLSSCAGYRLGGGKPPSLSSVTRISVPMFKNETQHPRAEAIATSAVAAALSQDGTYKVSSTDQADAILEGTLEKIQYTSIRGTRLDTLLPEELHNQVEISWVLKDARDPTKTLASGKSSGKSQLFVDTNLQTARNNALPDALERAGESLVSTLSNGY
ncbi:LPS assembly lipoprotein LptE [Luteolibacter sp. SL250]|uniref:LPS assembly lipoprotein LptE n=1 Tax=Luteolibacter sp. SL250 TaxID=2995170 RepID=UPI002271828E|nr:LPS assembly lipoprotein LptE [Luteolibacter sp. SL250]WAC20791.1 LPS assembly lipoprotein LptE [Luteolibacter sp. SL250]